MCGHSFFSFYPWIIFTRLKLPFLKKTILAHSLSLSLMATTLFFRPPHCIKPMGNKEPLLPKKQCISDSTMRHHPCSHSYSFWERASLFSATTSTSIHALVSDSGDRELDDRGGDYATVDEIKQTLYGALRGWWYSISSSRRTNCVCYLIIANVVKLQRHWQGSFWGDI